MLMFAAKMYQIHDIVDVLKPMLKSGVSLHYNPLLLIGKSKFFGTSDCKFCWWLFSFQVDNYLSISDDFQVYMKPQADVKEYCSGHDNQAAKVLLAKLQSKMSKSYEIIIDILVQKLSSITEVYFWRITHWFFLWLVFIRGGSMGGMSSKTGSSFVYP